MSLYPDDRVLIAIMNNKKDWVIVQDQGWYRIPVKRAPECVPNIDCIAFYFTAKFGSDKWAVHYYAPVQGHELLTRADLFPNQTDHPRAGNWYYKMMLGPVVHKLPPIVSHKWRRITFITTTGDRFENAVEINDLFDRESPLGRLYVSLKEEGYSVEQFWHIEENSTSYHVDLAVETPGGWLPVTLSAETPAPQNTLHLSATDSIQECVAQVKAQLRRA